MTVPTRILLPLLAAMLCPAPVLAGAWDDAHHPPDTRMQDDVALPMPILEGEALSMVFRKVRVPGTGYWGDEKRELRFGFAGSAAKRDDAVFENQQRLLVGGSFPENDAWYIYVGKYETSIGQFVAVMGASDLEAGIAAYDAAVGGSDKKNMQRLRSPERLVRAKVYSLPMRWMRLADVRAFLAAYNRWCFDDAACTRAMPSLAESPGFFRLPTEDEWEYVARGGYEAATGNDKSFERAAPFEAARAEVFAQISSKEPLPIGSREATEGGFHDLYGNVQEMTEGLFRTNMTQGKVGGVAARGGGFRVDRGRLRASLREEVPLYSSDRKGRIGEARNSETGFRLAIGSLAVPSRGYLNDVVIAEAPKARAAQSNTSAALSMAKPIVQAQDSVKRIVELADWVAQRTGDDGLRTAMSDIKRAADEAQREMNAEKRETAMRILRENLIRLSNYGEKVYETLFDVQTIQEQRGRIAEFQTLAQADAYYQEDVAIERERLSIMERDLRAERANMEKLWRRYLVGVRDAAEYRSAVDDPLAQLESQPLRQGDKAAFGLLRAHVTAHRAGDIDAERWRSNADQVFRSGATWQ